MSRKLVADHDETFRRLYDAYYQWVVAYFVRLRFTRDEARDLAQDVFVRVFRSMDSYRGSAPLSFLRTAASRIALNEWRRRRTQGRFPSPSSLDALPDTAKSSVIRSVESEPPPSPERALLVRELRQRLQQALAELPEGMRHCVTARIAGLSYHEIAAAFGLTEDAVKSKLHEARKRLRIRLGEEIPGLD